MKIENVKTIKIKIAHFEQFEFNYAQLANVECQFEDSDTVMITIKPNEDATQLEENKEV
jgi:hypothetical protein